jgi:vacuolar protein sorting-associated protein 13A/C
VGRPSTPINEKNSVYPGSDPFFFVKFEHNPLDERADNAITLKMKAMEVIYHRGYLEAIYRFLKPPESQLESVAALLVCSLFTPQGWLANKISTLSERCE